MGSFYQIMWYKDLLPKSELGHRRSNAAAEVAAPSTPQTASAKTANKFPHGNISRILGVNTAESRVSSSRITFSRLSALGFSSRIFEVVGR
jgi:hypothetical protein